MIQNIRQTIFQMLVLADYKGDKEAFITQFLRECQRNLSPGYVSKDEYYMELHKAAQKSVKKFIRKFTPQVSPSQLRNLRLLAHSFSLLSD